MSYQDEIDKALTAHAAWKQRLNAAITNGSSELPVAQVRVDNLCEFGKWFYKLPLEMRNTTHGANIQKSHAEFHVEAAKILDFALKGKTEEAIQLLGPNSKFASISGKLYLALRQWKQEL